MDFNKANGLVVEVKGKVGELEAELVNMSLGMEAELKASYDKGFADGKASMANAGDKVYSQAELDAIIVPIQDSLVQKEGQISSMQAEIDSIKASIDGSVAAGIAAFKADLKAKYEEQQVAESAGETGFAEFLK